jgi:hypothetical protein
MSWTLSRVITRIGVPALAVGAVFAIATAAGAATAPSIPIGHNQRFVGVVNGATTHASIRLTCRGPVGKGHTGHPLPGQFVEATPGVFANAPVGFTGAAGDALTVALLLREPLGQVQRFPIGTITAYGTKVPIPETLTLPCVGAGRVVFVPTPTSATARTAAVPVRLVGLP